MTVFVQFRTGALGLALIFALASCAGINQKSPQENSQENLVKRVNAYWQHKIDGSIDKAYLFEDPNFREKLTLMDYIKSTGVNAKWLKATIENVTLNNENAEIIIQITYINPMAKFNPKEGRVTTVPDYWVFKENNWYHVFEAPKTK